MIPRRAWIYACAVVALTVAVLTQSGADSLIVQPVARNPRPPSGAAATSTGSAPPRSGGQAGPLRRDFLRLDEPGDAGGA